MIIFVESDHYETASSPSWDKQPMDIARVCMDLDRCTSSKECSGLLSYTILKY